MRIKPLQTYRLNDALIERASVHLSISRDASSFKRPIDLWTRGRKLSTFDLSYDFHPHPIPRGLNPRGRSAKPARK